MMMTHKDHSQEEPEISRRCLNALAIIIVAIVAFVSAASAQVP